MTNNDDPLIAEIEKMILDLKAEYDKHPSPVWRGKIGFTILKLGELHKVAVADRARQQEEKEKMIAELKAKAIKPTDDPYCDDFVRLSHALEIIQGKEQEQERARE